MALLPTIVSWYGGKQRLARQIISIMPEHEHYVEVFMGSAAVFFNKPKSPRNCINDINENLVNLFIQVRDNYDELAEKAYWTLCSRKQYVAFVKLYENNFKDATLVERAVAYLFLVRSNFNNQIGTGFAASIDSNSATFNLSLLNRLKLAREKLDGVIIENKQYFEIIEKYDQNGSMFYLDPPYWVADIRTYYYENIFNKTKHIVMAQALDKCKSPWIVSYDNVPEIVDLYKEHYITRLSVVYHSLGKKARNLKLDELLITNFKCKKPQLDVFDEAIEEVEVTDEEKLSAEKHVKLQKEIQLEKEARTIIITEDNGKPSRPTEQSQQTSLFD